MGPLLEFLSFDRFRVETINGTATAPEDYIHLEEDVHFAVNEQLRQLYVEIIDDNEWEPDEFFFVKLSLPEKEENEDIVLGNISITQVTIINDDGRSDSYIIFISYIICSAKIKIILILLLVTKF